MSNSPYARWPSLHDDTVVFVAEDDLWTVSAEGGVARRLTTALSSISRPILSPDGARIAFAGQDEGGVELYTMPAEGGEAERLTYTGGACRVFAWTREGSVLFGANHAHPFGLLEAYEVEPGKSPKRLPYGAVSNLAPGPNGAVAIGRFNHDSARWKRYRGGTAGDLWVDSQGQGAFRRLVDLKGNPGHPMWVGGRIYFVSDHEGIANIYSATPEGEDLQRHSASKDFYVRWPHAHEGRIVYQAGGELWILDTADQRNRRLDIRLNSPRIQRQRKFVDAARYLESFDIHPEGHSLAIAARGRAFSFPLWERAVRDYESSGDRQRLPVWLHDGERLALLSDESGEEGLSICDGQGHRQALDIKGNIGRPIAMVASPTEDRLLIANHAYELILVDLEAKTAVQVDKSRHGQITGPTWAPDGRWFAYTCPSSGTRAEVRLGQIDEDGKAEIKASTEPVLIDYAPSFSPDGRILYFLSGRVFNPVYDDLHFSLGFPRGTVPCLILLRRDDLSPFDPAPRAPGQPFKMAPEDKKDTEDKASEGQDGDQKDGDQKDGDQKDGDGEAKKPPQVVVDLEGLNDRVIALPVDEGRYAQIIGAADNKVIYTRDPVAGSLGQSWAGSEPSADRALLVYDLAAQKESTIVDNITAVKLINQGKILGLRKGNRLRVCKLADKLPKESGNSRASGWIDLARIRLRVDPAAEWAQMMREAWRLQRDHFWDASMSKIDWQLIFDRYRPLLERVATRGEFSDLMWEMQGELGTSHAYEIGGDHRSGRSYPQGKLGADIAWDGKGWRIDHILRGDQWTKSGLSPLAAPGLNIAEGSYITAIAGRKVDADHAPDPLLFNRAGKAVEIAIADAPDAEPRHVVVTPTRSETAMRYREWVEGNRAKIHDATDGRVGYLHIPDMGPEGFAEFFRGFLAEVNRDGLIVDARFNRGGHVSQLLLEKLARKRLGYDIQRHGDPEPYPAYTIPGPMVALTNEYAGSDGDIFSHSFKMLGLGKLIGKRTWGGVIGIWPRHRLADGTITTQPEFSFWFHDVGYQVENYGTDPDIEIEIPPQTQGDPQLDRAIQEAMTALETTPVQLPNFDPKPDLSLPRLQW